MAQPNTDANETASRARLVAPDWLSVLPDRALEMMAVLLLSIASLSAAWAGYQASRWSAEQSMLYSQASAIRVESSRSSTIGYMLALGDLTVFNSWAEAVAVGDEALVGFNAKRFSPDLATAVADWEALDPLNNPDAPGGPFENNYSNQPMEEAVDLQQEAESTFRQGQVASGHNEDYVQLTVIFAMVLFFGGISSRIVWYSPKLLVLVVATGLLGYGLVRLFTYPTV